MTSKCILTVFCKTKQFHGFLNIRSEFIIKWKVGWNGNDLQLNLKRVMIIKIKVVSSLREEISWEMLLFYDFASKDERHNKTKFVH